LVSLENCVREREGGPAKGNNQKATWEVKASESRVVSGHAAETPLEHIARKKDWSYR